MCNPAGAARAVRSMSLWCRCDVSRPRRQLEFPPTNCPTRWDRDQARFPGPVNLNRRAASPARDGGRGPPRGHRPREWPRRRPSRLAAPGEARWHWQWHAGGCHHCQVRACPLTNRHGARGRGAETRTITSYLIVSVPGRSRLSVQGASTVRETLKHKSSQRTYAVVRFCSVVQVNFLPADA